ncbi:GNAT family N-acetyltransferase [Bacillus sp. CGMCC 1.16607]|uniref:GNAT family N-acetyltransferase n=1 Tax=Bacillus sp. CGMCC 1.16607 TaxID=3351842 RepID=UPI0036272092
MIVKLDLHNKEITQNILDVQIPSYKVEAELINFDGIPQLNDTVENISESPEIFMGYYINHELVAFISFDMNENEIEICRLVVHPNHFRKGIGKKLVEYVIKEISKDKKVIVSTGQKNFPAKKLYEFFGFKEVKNIEVATDVYITLLELN